MVLCFTVLLNAACLGHSPGEVYFEVYTKDASGNYTVQSLYKTINYGQTATLVAENFNATIFKDKAPGYFTKYRWATKHCIFPRILAELGNGRVLLLELEKVLD